MENIIKNDMDLLRPNDGDVYLVAYPKAGVTWMTEIVTAIYREYALENPNCAPEFDNAVRAHAFCEVCPMSRRVSGGKNKKVIGYDANGNEIFENESEKRRRIVSLHFPAKRMEKMMPDAFNNANVKMIYIARNPKDIAVSYYHFHCMNDVLPTPNSWQEFLEDFTNGSVRWGSWFDHVRGWWRKHEEMISENKSQLLWLTFESLKKDLKGEMRKICEHLGLELSEEGLDMAVKRCTFASMKADPNRNHSKNKIFKGDFLRKGKVGDWKSKFTDEQNIQFNLALANHLKEDFSTLTRNFTVGERIQ
uniref:sulfotransferase family cytosolic 1B member 1-like isoform X1 n=1 Tax=Styela clava TaxID=7725 RepID=UPI00193AAA2A|nr:sulfotransferase family cytosolic 1B member 1-like isoform X1 [Styela clava]